MIAEIEKKRATVRAGKDAYARDNITAADGKPQRKCEPVELIVVPQVDWRWPACACVHMHAHAYRYMFTSTRMHTRVWIYG